MKYTRRYLSRQRILRGIKKYNHNWLNTLIKQYHSPESIWKGFKVNTHEEFMKTFFRKGKFHKNVPDQIKKDYGKVERVFCYAYYHYPLIDEAFSIATRIFEAAITMRLEELKLSKNGNLEKKITRLEEFSSPQLLDQWNHTRKLRNHFAHVTPGALMGITLMRGFAQLNNILNTVFLSREEILKDEFRLTELKTKADYLKDGLYVLNDADKSYLIYSAIPYSYAEFNTVEKTFWAFHPVLIDFPQTMENLAFSNPIFKSLHSISISKEGLQGKEVGTNKQISLSPTDDPNNIEAYQRYRDLFNSAEEMVKISFNTHIKMEINYSVVNFLYNEAWE